MSVDLRGRRVIETVTVTLTRTPINATLIGNTTIITPAAGRRLRLHLFILVNNGAAVNRAGLRFGAAGTINFRGDLAADGGTRAMNLIDAEVEGAADEALIVNLDAAGDIDVTVVTEEFT